MGTFSLRPFVHTSRVCPLGVFFLLLAALVLLPTRDARAQGFGVFEQGACAMGRAETGVAQPCDDGSAIFYNPAGLNGRHNVTVTAGLTVIAASGDFTDDYTGQNTSLDNDPIPVPHFFATYGFSDRLSAGLGVYVPYGLGTQWPIDFDGAFLGYDNSLQSIYVQPTLAYRLTDRISLGAGLIVARSSVELSQCIDLSQQQVPGQPVTFAQLGIPFHTPFADSRLEGSATGVGGNVGLEVQATDRIAFGARFMTPVTFSYDGDAIFEPMATGLVISEGSPFTGPPLNLPPGTSLDVLFEAMGTFADGGTLEDQGIETEITMPAQFVAGVSIRATNRLTLLADYQWTGWSAFDVISLNFDNAALNRTQIENYGDTNAIRLGAEYGVGRAWTVRAGYLFNQAAAPDLTVTPLLPEADRNHVTAGVTWQPSDLLTLNAAYQYLGQNDRRGRVRDLPSESTSAEDINSGLYSFNAHLFGVTMTLHF